MFLKQLEDSLVAMGEKGSIEEESTEEGVLLSL